MEKKYFVTGATGVIGSALIPLLLEDKNSQIWALMRADSPEHMQKRLEELITFWEMDHKHAQDARWRIIPLLGDLDKSKFGLSEDVYEEIANHCTHIIHCAGIVRMNLPLEVTRQHAIGSAQNIV
jgi:thioester reductase-like protein